MFELKKAQRKQSRLRIGVSAPSGAGKTYSALLMARGIASAWDKIAVIDTENSCGFYDHLGEYNAITLDAPFSPERYIEAIQACEKAGMEVIIIDSTSHEWEGKGGLLESNEKLAQAKFKGNTWSAWSETTPRHQRFIEAIVMSPCHVITTARSKTDTIMTDDKRVKKVGTKDIQREGFEYELTIAFNIDRDTHCATASKDRTGIFIDATPFVINEETGKTLNKWATSGTIDTTIEERKERRAIISELLEKLGKTEEWYFEQLKLSPLSTPIKKLDSIIEILKNKVDEKEKEKARIEEEKAHDATLQPVTAGL